MVIGRRACRLDRDGDADDSEGIEPVASFTPFSAMSTDGRAARTVIDTLEARRGREAREDRRQGASFSASDTRVASFASVAASTLPTQRTATADPSST